MKSILKRVSSVVMAAAMVLSVAAVSPVDAQAASKLAITKKSAITAGKTYTYNVKGVTKAQYIKVKMSSGVTVKCNSKTVKKNVTKINGGKTIALKVKAADKVANYKATVKAVVYDKKTNKKVKTLTTQSTVKVQALKVLDVYTGSTTGKYLIAEFNKSLTSLNPADIKLVNLNTNETKMVEDVKLASNGKSATITLAGSEDANANGSSQGVLGAINNSFVEPNVDYRLTITQSGVSASKDFTIDAVTAYVSVIEYNAALNEITVTKPVKSSNSNVNKYATTVKLSPSVLSSTGKDYQELLGRTLSIWYDKNDVATRVKLAEDDSQVIEGAFEYINRDAATAYLKDKATGIEYPVSKYIGNTSDVHETYEIAPRNGKFGIVATYELYDDHGVFQKLQNGAALAVGTPSNYYTRFYADNQFASYGDKQDIDYAKLVLYSNGKVRTMVDMCDATYVQTKGTYTGSFITKVEADKNLVYEGATAHNLKNYTIIKDGKLASIKDIAVGDVVFMKKNLGFAEIYTVTKEGKIDAAYDKEFVFSGTRYNNDDVKVVKVDSKNAFEKADPMTYVEGAAFVKAGGAATAYLNRAGQVKFVTGKQQYEAGPTKTKVLAVSPLKYYELANKKYVQFMGFDGTATASYDICTNDVKEIDGVKTGITYDTETDTTNKFADVMIGGKSVASGNSIVGKFVDVVTEPSGKKSITFTTEYLGNPAKDEFVAGDKYVTVGTQNYQIKGDAPIFSGSIDKSKASWVIKNPQKVDYSKYSAKAVSANVAVYGEGSTGKPYGVTRVYINDDITPTTVNYVEGVVTSVASKDKKADTLVVMVGTKEYTFKEFRDDDVKSDVYNNAELGKFVRIGTTNNDTVVVSAVRAGAMKDVSPVTTGFINSINVSDGTFVVGGTTYKLAATNTIVARKKTGSTNVYDYETAVFADLTNLVDKVDEISFHVLNDDAGVAANGTNYVDAIVIKWNSQW